MDKKTNRPKIWMYKDKMTGRMKGECTVTYDDPYTAQSAIKWFDGKSFSDPSRYKWRNDRRAIMKEVEADMEEWVVEEAAAAVEDVVEKTEAGAAGTREEEEEEGEEVAAAVEEEEEDVALTNGNVC